MTVVQLPELQQPLGQEVASQLHRPLEQCLPDGQAAPLVPHWHTPPAEQLSATVALQTVHCAPPAPQAEVERATQSLLLQQLLGHEAASHTQALPMHSWPA